MAVYKEFLYETSSEPSNFREYSWPVNLYWQSARITFLQMFPMKGISILNFNHSHSFTDICYCLSGTGRLQFGDNDYVWLERGTICYVNSKVVHRVIPDAGSDLYLCNISFVVTPHRSNDKIPEHIVREEELLLRKLADSRYLSASGCYHCEDFLRNALTLMNSKTPGDFVLFKNCISNFLMTAFQALVKPECPSGRVQPEDEMILNTMQLVFYLRDHYTEGITLNDVAAALNYSPRQCQRLMQDSLGVGFTEFILAHQIQLAKQLLLSSDASLEEIAEQAGFKSSKALSQQFKAMTGVTPFIFRKNARQQDAPEIGTDFML